MLLVGLTYLFHVRNLAVAHPRFSNPDNSRVVRLRSQSRYMCVTHDQDWRDLNSKQLDLVEPLYAAPIAK